MKGNQSSTRSWHSSHTDLYWLVFVGLCIAIWVLAHTAVKLVAGLSGAIDAFAASFAAGLTMIGRIGCLVIEVLWLCASGRQLEALFRALDLLDVLGSE